MIKKTILSIFLFFLTSCNGLEFVLNDSDLPNQLKGKTSIAVKGSGAERLTKELFSFFGNTEGGDFILIATFLEKKENRLVKKNQVAEKVAFDIVVDYNIFYKSTDCKIFAKKIISKFSFVPKSFGYNFGTDRSFEKLYVNSLRKNIKKLINYFPSDRTCK